MPDVTRRRLMGAAAALPLAGLATPLMAEAPPLGPSFARHRRFMLGSFEVTTILARTNMRPDPQEIFGLNVPEEEFEEVSRAHFLSTDESRFWFTPTVVNTGSQVILFDFPRDASEYMRRVGRTARAGRRGLMTALVAGRQLPLARGIIASNRRGDRLHGLPDAADTASDHRDTGAAASARSPPRRAGSGQSRTRKRK